MVDDVGERDQKLFFSGGEGYTWIIKGMEECTAIDVSYGKVDAAVIDDCYSVSNLPIATQAVKDGSLPLSLYSLGPSLLLMLNEDDALEEA